MLSLCGECMCADVFSVVDLVQNTLDEHAKSSVLEYFYRKGRSYPSNYSKVVQYVFCFVLFVCLSIFLVCLSVCLSISFVFYAFVCFSVLVLRPTAEMQLFF